MTKYIAAELTHSVSRIALGDSKPRVIRMRISPEQAKEPKSTLAVGYVRYSSSAQNANSIDRQVERIYERAAMIGVEIIEIYEDREKSGAVIYGRSGLLRLLDDAKVCRFGILITESIDRLSRDQCDVHYIYKKLKRYKVDLYDCKSKVEPIHITFGAFLAQEMRKQMRILVAAGRKLSFEDGTDLHRARFGYMKDPKRRGRTLPHPDRAPAAEYCYSSFLRGASLAMIANELSGKYPTPGDCVEIDQGTWSGAPWSPWTPNMVREILCAPLYMGLLVDGVTKVERDEDTFELLPRTLRPAREWTIVEVPHCRIVSKDDWFAAKDLMDERRQNRAERDNCAHYLLTHRLFCSSCESSLTFHYANRRRETMVRCDACRELGDANAVNLTISSVERAVLSTLIESVLCPEAVDAFREEIDKRVECVLAEARIKREGLVTERERLSRALDRLLDKAIYENFSEDRIAKFSNRTESRIQEIDSELAKIATPIAATKPTETVKSLKACVSAILDDTPFKATDVESQLLVKLIRSGVKRVEIAHAGENDSCAASIHVDLGPLLGRAIPPELDIGRLRVFRAEVPCCSKPVKDPERSFTEAYAEVGGELSPDLTNKFIGDIGFLEPTASALGWSLPSLTNAVRFLACNWHGNFQRVMPGNFGSSERLEEAVIAFLKSGAFDILVQQLESTAHQIHHPDRFFPNVPRPTAEDGRKRRLLADVVGDEDCRFRATVVAMCMDGVCPKVVGPIVGLPADAIEDLHFAYLAGSVERMVSFDVYADLHAAAAAAVSPEHEQRLTALAMLAAGASELEASNATGLQPGNVRKWARIWRDKGYLGLRSQIWKLRAHPVKPGPVSRLISSRLANAGVRAHGIWRGRLGALQLFFSGATRKEILARVGGRELEFVTTLELCRVHGADQLIHLIQQDRNALGSDLRDRAERMAGPGMAQRMLLIAEHFEGSSIERLAETYAIDKGRIEDVVKYWRLRGMVRPNRKGAAPRLNPAHMQQLGEIMDGAIDPDNPAAPITMDGLVRICRDRFRITVSNEAVRRSCVRAGVRTKGPMIPNDRDLAFKDIAESWTLMEREDEKAEKKYA